jgi:hypothetical protein
VHGHRLLLRGRRTSWLQGLALIGAVAGFAEAQDAPLTIPLHDPAYVVLDGLDNAGCSAARVSPYRPFTVPQVRAALRAAADDPMCPAALVGVLRARFDPNATDGNPSQGISTESDSSGRVHIGAAATVRVTALGQGEFRPLWADLREKDAGTPPVVGMLRVRGRWMPTGRIAAAIEAYGQSHSRNDPFVRARLLRSTTGVVGVSEATIAGKAGPFTISFGRDREAWLGRGIESLVLSAQGPPLDRLAVSLSTRHFEGRALYAMLDDVVLDEERGELPVGTADQRFYRALVAHTLTWRPSRVLELTAGETVLLSRGSRTLDLGYANPLMPFIVTQNDAGREGSETRDNIAAFISVRSQFGRTRLVGELLIDDIQIDAGDRELTPDQLGWRFEGRQGWGGAWPGSIGAEYERVNSFTYRRGYYTDVYQFVDRPLGSELGPDADRIQGVAEIWGGTALRLSSRVGLWRRGAQRIDERPSVGAVGNAGLPFPSTSAERPFAQRALLGDITADVVRWKFPITATVEVARIEHPGHIAGGSATYMRAHLNATYAFRYP